MCWVGGGEDRGDDGRIGGGFDLALSRGGVDVCSCEGNEGGRNDCASIVSYSPTVNSIVLTISGTSAITALGPELGRG